LFFFNSVKAGTSVWDTLLDYLRDTILRYINLLCIVLYYHFCDDHQMINASRTCMGISLSS